MIKNVSNLIVVVVGLTVLLVSGCATGPKKPGAKQGVLLDDSIENLQTATLNILKSSGFEIRENVPGHIGAFLPSNLNKMKGFKSIIEAGKSKVGVWFDPVTENRSRVSVKTTKAFVGLMHYQGTWDDYIISQLKWKTLLASVSESAKDSFSVHVKDNRTYVLDGEKPKSYKGRIRGDWSIPFHFYTNNEEPFSEELGRIFKRELALNQIKTDSSTLNKKLLVTLNDWKSDFYHRGSHTLIYSIKVSVIDSGNVRGEKHFEGRDTSAFDSTKDPILFKIERIYHEKINAILRDPDIVKALDG